MNVDDTTPGGRLGSSRECRLTPGFKSRPCGLCWLEDGSTAEAVARQMIRMRSSATVPAVATVESDGSSNRGRQYRNPSRTRHGEIQSQTRSVSGTAALVTTPLRSLVTRATSDQASPVPGTRLSQSSHFLADTILRSVVAYPQGSTGAAGCGPALGTRV
jgi:hypothetical protein